MDLLTFKLKIMKSSKRYFNQIFTFLILASLFVSCAKDKGNYSYEEVEAIKIEVDMAAVDPDKVITSDSIAVNSNDSLFIKLKVENENNRKLDYKWYITQYTQSDGNPPEYQISTEKDLRTKISLKPNIFRLIAKATDTESGVSYYKFFTLNVSVAEWASEGWIVLQDVGDGSDISVITTRDGSSRGNIFHNIYSSVNNHKLPIGTSKINVINYNATLRAQRITAFAPGTGLELRSIDFADSSRSDSWFVGGIGAANFQANGTANGTTAGHEYIIVNDRISYRQVGSAAHLASPPRFYPPFEGVVIAPFVINAAASDQTITLFDKVNKSFVLFNTVSSALTIPPNYVQPPSNLNPITGQGFDMKNMIGDLIHAENAQASNLSTSIYWNCFFRNADDNNKTYLVQFLRGLSYRNEFTTGRFQLDEANCPGINTATIFANPTHLPLPGGAFYYVNGNNIYTTKVTTLNSSKATKDLTFAPGTIVKTMKVFNSGYSQPNITASGIKEGRVLVVATDESAIGEGHKVYFFELDRNTGAIIGTKDSPMQVYTGFDKITDIVFKKALGR